MKTWYYNYRKESSNWWLIAIGGTLLVGVGIWTLLSPFDSYLSLSLIFAAVMVAAGFFEILFSMANFRHFRGWGWHLLTGAVDCFVGIYLFSYPLITMIILPVVIGLWLLFRGLITTGTALGLQTGGLNSWIWLLVIGVFNILIAFVILFHPALGISGLIIWTGVAFMLAGVFRVYLSVRLKQIIN